MASQKNIAKIPDFKLSPPKKNKTDLKTSENVSSHVSMGWCLIDLSSIFNKSRN